jgi:O-antigen/teichoic acid export membrane protein
LAYQFFEASLAIPIFFANAIYPLLANLFKKNVGQFKLEFKRWAHLLVFFSIILVLLLIFVSFFIPVIFGREFSQSQTALRVLALGIPFFFLSALVWHAIILYSRQKYLITVYALGALFNIVANLIFIPRYGHLSAAVITVVSEALILLMLFFVYLKIERETKL